jgi:dTDP-glucose pyrophosphorylase
MMPIGGKPFLEYQIEWLRMWGVNDIILAAGYKADEIRTSSCWETIVEPEPLGTSGAVRYAVENSKHMVNDPVIIMNGDTMVDVDLWRMVGSHVTNDALMTLGVKDGIPAGIYVSSTCMARRLPTPGMLEELPISSKYEVTSYLDVGTPDGYDKAESYLAAFESALTH